MKNKIKLKKLIVTLVILSFILVNIFLLINTYEYHSYTTTFNQKINLIILKIKEKYPKIKDEEIIEIINNNKGVDTSFLTKYGININKDSILLENDSKYHKFLLINSIFIIITIILLLYLFLRYEIKKDKEINSITKYIKQINKKIYTLQIDDISEDELSILKNEIYKTTIMLKESADNSLKDKKELKKSLEDISHQLKTPLTSILIMLDNLIDDSMDNKTKREFIRNIKREVTNINFLVQIILKLSKFDANTIEFINKDIFVYDIIEQSIKNLASICDLKNIKANINGNKKIMINCDFMWQVEAITNILKNCIEHSPYNSMLDINYEKNNIYTTIIIKDYGKGIDKKDLPHIFERFYKGKNSSSDSIGIGLSLAKTIIEKNNGTISVDTTNKGTIFIIKYYNI